MYVDKEAPPGVPVTQNPLPTCATHPGGKGWDKNCIEYFPPVGCGAAKS